MFLHVCMHDIAIAVYLSMRSFHTFQRRSRNSRKRTTIRLTSRRRRLRSRRDMSLSRTDPRKCSSALVSCKWYPSNHASPELSVSSRQHWYDTHTHTHTHTHSLSLSRTRARMGMRDCHAVNATTSVTHSGVLTLPPLVCTHSYVYSP